MKKLLMTTLLFALPLTSACNDIQSLRQVPIFFVENIEEAEVTFFKDPATKKLILKIDNALGSTTLSTGTGDMQENLKQLNINDPDAYTIATISVWEEGNSTKACLDETTIITGKTRAILLSQRLPK